MKFIIENNFEKDKCNDYIAIGYKVNSPNSEGVPEPDGITPATFVRVSRNEGHISLKLKREYRFLPIIQQCKTNNLQRSVIVIFGASGSGKSVLTNSICKTYNKFKPNQKIYFISNNNVKIDKSLTHEIYTFIKADDIIEKYSDPEELNDFKTNNDFNNSLIVFDDVDFENDIKAKKVFFAFLGVILKFKRKNLINVIYTTHHVTDYKYTRELLRELTDYYFFGGDIKNRSNRVLAEYLKLTKPEIARLTSDENSTWKGINTTKRVVLSPNEMYSLT